MTRPDLSFAFAELSKFACSTLSYLVGTADSGITYSRPAKASQINKLHGWVDSDYASDPDTSGILHLNEQWSDQLEG